MASSSAKLMRGKKINSNYCSIGAGFGELICIRFLEQCSSIESVPQMLTTHVMSKIKPLFLYPTSPSGCHPNFPTIHFEAKLIKRHLHTLLLLPSLLKPLGSGFPSPPHSRAVLTFHHFFTFAQPRRTSESPAFRPAAVT